MKFKEGDRIRFTTDTLDLLGTVIDPTIIESDVEARLKHVEFDDPYWNKGIPVLKFCRKLTKLEKAMK